ncbi:hypothetical protein [Achromobacter arsenitoxydans]|uniref:Uncharacterized protein n=1 Tax=Achromobacter arsenitoxydans SY8 TaxID=477184 RepID=H0FD40_9BURK|nr:hypothetical protein [Achromobacter arsenitoxydans]EHK63833.1 hypothetical protein KYC_23498 [Achromobacter arsenitoxydans SY8]
MSNTTPLAALYQRVVQEELGLVAQVDEDGDVLFRHPDLGTMYFSLTEKDPEFMRLIYPNFVSAEELGMSKDTLLEVLNTVNHRCKAVKLTLPQGGGDAASRVSAAIEAVIAAADQLPSEDLLRGILARCVSAIRHGARELLKEALELKEGAARSAD